MIRTEGYSLNTDLDSMLRSLQLSIARRDDDEISGLTDNVAYLLRQTISWRMPYNAFQITAAVDVSRKDLPAVPTDTYRPHHYLRALGQLPETGIVKMELVLPAPLEVETEIPYAFAVRTYPSADMRRVSGCTVNLGTRVPHHVFFYANEIQQLSFGHAVEGEHPKLLARR